MFDIAFLDRGPERQEDGWYALRGRIVLGEFSEEFLAPLDHWSAADYQLHWVEAARRLVHGGYDRTGFLTSFQFLWMMWRDGDDVRVQEKMLIDETLLAPFDPKNPYLQIDEYTGLTEDGMPLSEWRVAIDDVREFLDRLESGG
jgi:hypothetical protein